MSADEQGSALGADAELLFFGRKLVAAAAGLNQDPYGRLCGAMAATRLLLETAGPRFAQGVSWLGQRAGYLADAASAVDDGVIRLEVALAAPTESDLSVRVVRLRGHVEYFADVASDVVPPALYLDLGRDLLPTIEEGYGAPGLALQLLPLVERVLDRMRAACGFGTVLVDRARSVLTLPFPGAISTAGEAASLESVHRAEIDRLISALRASRPALAARPREDEATRTRALLEYLHLTPAQLAAMLARIGSMEGPEPG